MNDTQLTTLSAFAWIVATVFVFNLLARWSSGGTWGISTAIAQGLIGWTGRNGIIAGEWSGDDELPPIALPPADRPNLSARRSKELAFDPHPRAEIEDLGSRRLA